MSWVSCVYHRANQDFDDDQGIAFVAGTLHTRRAVSFDRPERLSELLDQQTLNFLAGWGISGLQLRRRDVMDMVEGHTRILDSFRAGVLYAIEQLREVVVPEGVNVVDCKGVVDALEGFAHEQYIHLSREVERLEGDVLMRRLTLNAMGAGEAEPGSAQYEESTKGASEDDKTFVDDPEIQGTEQEDQVMGGTEDQGEMPTAENKSKLQGEPDGEEVAPKRMSKRARQRKAKKAKKQAEREAKAAEEAEEAEEAENTPTME